MRLLIALAATGLWFQGCDDTTSPHKDQSARDGGVISDANSALGDAQEAREQGVGADGQAGGDLGSSLDGSTGTPDGALQCPPVGMDCEGIEPHSANAPNRYPIVFVHGMGGFENLGPIDYFFGIPALLRENGYDVHITVADPFNSSEIRVEQIAPQIDKILACTCRPKVNLIGHSQGGIDGRLLISGFDYGHRVASLTTIASPHGGTAIADALLGLTNGPVVGLLDGFMAVFTGVIYGPPMEDPNVRAAMTTCSVANSLQFNEEHPNVETVAYYSYAGFSGRLADGRPECEGPGLVVPDHGDTPTPALLAGFLYLGGPRTANDGLVTVESAKWGRFLGCVPADHLDEIGQLGGIVDSFDYRAFYLDLAEFLADEGH